MSEKATVKNLIYFISIIFYSTAVIGQCPVITGEDLIEDDDVSVLQNIPYGNNKKEYTQMLDLYTPGPFAACPDVELIVAIHAGGFAAGDKNGMKRWGYYLARKGYYVAVINYRLFLKSKSEFQEHLPNPILFIGGDDCQRMNEISFIDGLYKIDKAWYFAVQDSRTALAYVQQNLNERGKTIKNLMVLGESAGAITALGLSLGDQKDFNSYNPLLEKLYGPLDAGVRYDSVPQKSIDALICMSGGMFNVEQFVSKEDSLPILFFHGGSDYVVPLCEDNCYNERRLNGPLRLSELVDSFNLNIPVKMHVWADEGHTSHKHYDRISEIIMKELPFLNSDNLSGEKINLYPKNSLLYNCSVVALRNDIISISRFIPDNYSESGISVYPNPSNGTFTVSVPNMVGHGVRIRMFDPLGRLTLAKDVTCVTDSEILLQASHVKSGMYELLILEDIKDPVKLRILLK